MKYELKHNYISVLHNGGLSYGGSQQWFGGMLKRCGCSVIGAADILCYLHAPQVNSGNAENEKGTGTHLRQTDDSIMLPAHDRLRACREKNRNLSALNGKQVIPWPIYEQLARETGRSFLLIPFRGIPGFSMPWFFNRCLRKNGLAYRAHWGTGRGGIRRRVVQMIRDDIPVPVGIGFCLHKIWGPPSQRGIKLYEKRTADNGSVRGEDNRKPENDKPDMQTLKNNNTEGKGETYVWVKTVRNHFMVITGTDGRWASVSSWGQKFYIDLKELELLSRWDLLGLFTNIIRIRSVS